MSMRKLMIRLAKNVSMFLVIYPLLLQQCKSISVLTLQNETIARNRENGWGPWGEWQQCSRTCGGGVTYMLRNCTRFRAEGVTNCTGSNRMYSSCNIQDCPVGAGDFRFKQCSSYNDQPYGGRKHKWLPYALDSNFNSCELYCQAENSTFYAKLSDKVIDGTRCRPDSYDMCIDGSCQKVGCDMMLGSNLREDKCRECGGDGSSCYKVSGIFKDGHLPAGYVDVIFIPVGATNIEIVKQKPSRNFLAVRSSSGLYLLNGNRRVEGPHTLQAAGTKFHYLRKLDRNKAPENLHASGPTTEILHIDLLVQERNKGIRYTFYLPKGTRPPNGDTLEWVGTAWRRCSLGCGGGLQSRSLLCYRNGKKVRSSHCRTIQKPPRKQLCNTDPCLARWQTSGWSECSASCNGGLRHRQVYCAETSKHINSSQHKRLRVARCITDDSPVRPSIEEACNEFQCTEWKIGNWSRCSASCGSGLQTRNAICLSATNCNTSTAPEIVRECLGTFCIKNWVVTAWSKCTENCGEGMQTRSVRCASPQGILYDDLFCEDAQRPESNRTCRSSTSCIGSAQWLAGEWSKCSANCGKGVQTRRVACSIQGRFGLRILSDDYCNDQEKNLLVVRSCVKAVCKSKWFKGPWTSCSQSCNGGKKTRFVVCISESSLNSLPARDCEERVRPSEENICNVQECPTTSEAYTSILTYDKRTDNCSFTMYGCCLDRATPAKGWLMEGCPQVNQVKSDDCLSSTYGCCRDGHQAALGPKRHGCPEYGFCFVSRDRGRYCGSWLSRWYFDPVLSKCKHFWFGGCDGNSNNYRTYRDCIETCNVSSVIHSISQSTTNTSTMIISTTAAPTTGTVPIHQEILLPVLTGNASNVYVGSPNRKMSEQECSLPAKRGPCLGRIHRWYYDRLDGICKIFIFSGCDANANNFESRIQCRHACNINENEDTVTSHVSETSKCEEDRISAEFASQRVPECDQNTGKYLPLQCMRDFLGVTLSCWCVDEKTGEEIKGSRRSGSEVPNCDSSSSPSILNLCARTKYGCCPDGKTPRRGSHQSGCIGSLLIKPGHSLIYTKPGRSARLPCIAAGYPKPIIRWFKNQQEIFTARNGSLIIDNQNLYISSAQAQDIGTYVCLASNAVGLRRRKIVKLAFKEEEMQFRSKPMNTTVLFARSAHLKCRVRGSGFSISWFKDGMKLQLSKSIAIKPLGDLRIYKVQMSDSGNYTCVVSNTSKMMTASAYVTVQQVSRQATASSTTTEATTTQSQASQDCKDYTDYADCRLVAAAGMCKRKEYHGLCCVTCRKHYSQNISSVTRKHFS